jgi:hypothetical protein
MRNSASFMAILPHSRGAFLRPSSALATSARKIRASPLAVFATNGLANLICLRVPAVAAGPFDQFCKPRKKAKKKEGCGTPVNADSYPPHLAARHAPCRTRTPSGVPPRLSPMGLVIPKAQLQARLPGTRRRKAAGFSRRRLAPITASTSRTGHSAGRLMPEAARKRPAKPFAGTVLARRPGMPPEPPPSQRRGGAGNWTGDECQEAVTEKGTRRAWDL